MYLVAILPPSNIRRIVCDYQVSLFRGGSEPAALALPPHIPIAFFDSPPPRPGSLVQEAPFASCGFLEAPPWLLLEFGPNGELERIRSHLPDTISREWYPTGIGIPLAMGTWESALAGIESPVLGWKTSHLECFELKTEDPARWWEHVDYSGIWQVKLKRKID